MPLMGAPIHYVLKRVWSRMRQPPYSGGDGLFCLSSFRGG